MTPLTFTSIKSNLGAANSPSLSKDSWKRKSPFSGIPAFAQTYSMDLNFSKVWRKKEDRDFQFVTSVSTKRPPLNLPLCEPGKIDERVAVMIPHLPNCLINSLPLTPSLSPIATFAPCSGCLRMSIQDIIPICFAHSP